MRTGFGGLALFGILAGQLALASCGGDSGTPTSPTASSSTVVQSTGAVGASGATITIGSNGAVTPTSVTIAVGQSVTFVNSDTRAHEMSSDPHPSHINCPSMANVANVAPGQTKVSFGFAGRGTCGFHDHNEPTNAALRGSVVIQ